MRSISCARVPHRVVRGAAVRRDAARLPVVQATGQLADDEHVGAGEDLGLERAGRLEAGPHLRRPEVRVELELPADRQERRLRAGARNRRDRTPDRRQRRAGSRPRSRAAASVVVGQRRQPAPQRRAADGRLAEIELMPEAARPTTRRIEAAAATTSGPMPSPGSRRIDAFKSGLGIRIGIGFGFAIRDQGFRRFGIDGIRVHTPCPYPTSAGVAVKSGMPPRRTRADGGREAWRRRPRGRGR